MQSAVGAQQCCSLPLELKTTHQGGEKPPKELAPFKIQHVQTVEGLPSARLSKTLQPVATCFSLQDFSLFFRGAKYFTQTWSKIQVVVEFLPCWHFSLCSGCVIVVNLGIRP